MYDNKYDEYINDKFWALTPFFMLRVGLVPDTVKKGSCRWLSAFHIQLNSIK